MAERKTLEKQLSEAKKALALGGSGGGAAKAEDINGVKFNGEKVAVAVAVTDDLTGTYNAATLVNAGAEKVGGRGGGKPHLRYYLGLKFVLIRR